jgi:hypothetical protein
MGGWVGLRAGLDIMHKRKISLPYWELMPDSLVAQTIAKSLLLKLLCAMSMFGGSLVTTVWHVLRLWMEETPSRYGRKLRMY